MNLNTAKRLASLNERQLDEACREACYECTDTKRHIVEEILEVDIREKDVMYKCVFADDGSFDDNDDRVHSLFIREEKGKILADF
jgi:ribosomal protein S10